MCDKITYFIGSFYAVVTQTYRKYWTFHYFLLFHSANSHFTAFCPKAIKKKKAPPFGFLIT